MGWEDTDIGLSMTPTHTTSQEGLPPMGIGVVAIPLRALPAHGGIGTGTSPGGGTAIPGVGGDPLQQPDEPRRQRGEEGLGAKTGLEKLGQALHGPGVAADNLVLGGHGVGDEGVGAAEVLGGGEGVRGRAGPESAPSPQICCPASSTQLVLSQPSLRSRVNAPQIQLRSPTLPFPVRNSGLGAHLAPPAHCPPR